ncbi:MAG: redoxin domain-containing protein [Deltaproteobacteria bacterium]|nr:redoxin domain-containing protein [Deltaproteobacteria bacterium]
MIESSVSESGMIEPGRVVPQALLERLEGGRASLASMQGDGKALVLFVEAECPTSRLALRRLQTIAAALAHGGVKLVAVHQDPPAVAALTMRSCEADFAALSEPEPYAASAAFGVRTVPTAFLIGSDDRVEAVVEGWSRDAFADIAAGAALPKDDVDRLLDPAAHPVFKPGCASKNTLSAELLASARAAEGAFDEFEDLFERGWTDGLPVVPPTRSRVARMLGDYRADVSLGIVPPGTGELTLERLAVCAVLAGCHPSYFPVVKAAAHAVLDPAFNLHGVTNTTHSCGPVLIVNGPVRRRIGMNSGMNCLGGWNRANATIGRAIRLMSGLTGHGTPGVLDRSTMGQPGKIGFCFAENEEASPWESLASARGFEPGRSVVTAYAGDGPLTISDHYSRDPEEVARTIALGGSVAFSPHFYPLVTDTVFVVCPEHVATFAQAGWSKRDVAERIVEGSRRRVSDLRTGDQGPFTASLDDDAELTKWLSPDEIVLVVAGGDAGRFTMLLPPWVGFGFGSTMTSQLIDEV